MKNNIFKTFAFCAMFLALSCQKDQAPVAQEPESQEATYRFEVGSEAVKSYVGSADDCMQWEYQDQLGYLLVKGDGSMQEASNSPILEGGVRYYFGITPRKFAVAPGDKLYAWHKFQTGKGEIENLTTVRCFNLPAAQVFEDGKLKSPLPLVAEPYTFTTSHVTDENADMPVINFSNMYSLLEFKVYSTDAAYADETVQSITFASEGATLAGDFKMDVAALDPSLDIDFTAPSSSVTVSSNVGVAPDNTSAGVMMAVIPGTYIGTLTVVTDKAVYTKNLSELTFKRSGKHPMGFNLATADRNPDFPKTLYMVDDTGSVFEMQAVSGNSAIFWTKASTSSMNGTSFKFATKVDAGAIAADAVVYGYKGGALSTDADAEYIPLDPAYSLHGAYKPWYLGIDFVAGEILNRIEIARGSNATEANGASLITWVKSMPHNCEVVFTGFDKPVSQMINTIVFDRIDDAAATARYIGVSDSYELWYRPEQGWLLFNNSISTSKYVIIGMGASFPQSPYMDWPMSPADFLLTTGQALPLYNIQENIYRTEAYLTKDFEIQFYSAHAWANSITDWTSTTATKHTEGSLAWITPLDESTFVEGVYIIEYNSSTKVVKITKK